LFLPFGLTCDNYHTFDFESFDNDMKKLLSVEDANKLISGYDGLIANKQKAENQINEKINMYNGRLLQNFDNIKSKYLNTDIEHVKNNIKILDTTGLYRNEKLNVEVTFIKNKFPKPTLLPKIDYSNIINSAFPCHTSESCLKNMKKYENNLVDTVNNDLNNVDKKFEKLSKKNTILYNDLASYFQVNNEKTASKLKVSKRGISKEIFYNVGIKSNKYLINSNFYSLVSITKIDYSNVFPSFTNKDKNLEIKFNPSSKSYRLYNRTNNFIQIKSVSLYYNEGIYNLTSKNDNNDFFLELAPESYYTVKLHQTIKHSNYKNLTKSKAQQTTIKFGFAIKYTLGEQTQNMTLYSQNNYNLYPLIKDIY